MIIREQMGEVFTQESVAWMYINIPEDSFRIVVDSVHNAFVGYEFDNMEDVVAFKIRFGL